MLKQALLKATSISSGKEDATLSSKLNLRVDIASRNSVYTLRSSVRSPRPEESPRDTYRCGSVETVLSDASPCSTPSSFHSGNRPRSSSTTSNIVRIFQRLRTSTSPTEHVYSLRTTSSFDNHDTVFNALFSLFVTFCSTLKLLQRQGKIHYLMVQYRVYKIHLLHVNRHYVELTRCHNYYHRRGS